MAYSDDILALSPDHRWKFDGNSTDDVGALASTNTSVLFTGPALCQDVLNSMLTNADSDSCVSTASNDTSYAVNDVMYAGWFMTNGIQQPPCRLVGDGGITQSMAIYLGFGNSLVFEIDYGVTDTLQIYGSTPLEPNRPYHLAIGYTSSNVLVAYLDGVLQTETANDTGTSMSNTRGAIRFGGSSGTSDFALGGAALKLVSIKNGYYNQWCTFNNSILTTTQVREELFEKGVLADEIVTNQIELDALANTTQPDGPCTIRVTGNGTIDLIADNITFHSKASIHVQYTGTGTLNWTNTNGSNASIGSTTNGGTINFINPATLTIDGLIDGSEVRIYDYESYGDNNFDTELDGIESNTGTSFGFSHNGTVNTVVVQVLKPGYKEIIREYTLNSNNETLTLFPEVEENA